MKDPVCGMEIEPEQARTSKSFNGQTFWFCSDICAEKFSRNPEQYAKGEMISPVPVKGPSTRAAETLELPIGGMKCDKCASNLEAALKELKGVQRAQVNFASAKARIHYDPAVVKREEIFSLIRRRGLRWGLLRPK